MGRAAVVAVCVVAALLQVHLLQMASSQIPDNLGTWIDIAWRHQDNPHVFYWTGYHSRMLGVGLIELFGGTAQAFMEATGVALTLAGLLAWRLGSAGGLGILHACFAVWASPWFAPWDMFEPAIFLAFVVLVVEEFSWPWFVGLFAVSIFNLQSAMFIALWMTIRMPIAGVSCLVFGALVMWYFQHSGQPRLGLSVFQCLDGHTTGYSTDYAQERVVENFHKLFVLDSRCVAGVIAIIAGCAIAIMREHVALGLTFLALLGATLAFGIVDEMRVWLPFCGLMILAAQ